MGLIVRLSGSFIPITAFCVQPLMNDPIHPSSRNTLGTFLGANAKGIDRGRRRAAVGYTKQSALETFKEVDRQTHKLTHMHAHTPCKGPGVAFKNINSTMNPTFLN